jgi:mRNA-degrading endonuclease RelE of RelBE toxin-antitoxin system
MNLIYLPEALVGLRALPKADAKRIRDALEQVARSHPQRMPFVTEMVGHSGEWRLRKGDYRALYRVTEVGIVVVEIGPRQEIYR